MINSVATYDRVNQKRTCPKMMNSKQIVFLVVSVIILYFRAILADDQEELNLFTCLNSSSNCANETIALDGEIESDTKMDDVRVEALTTNLLKHSQSNKNLVGAKKLESTLEKHNPLKRKKNKYSKQGYCICDLTVSTTSFDDLLCLRYNNLEKLSL